MPDADDYLQQIGRAAASGAAAGGLGEMAKQSIGRVGIATGKSAAPASEGEAKMAFPSSDRAFPDTADI